MAAAETRKITMLENDRGSEDGFTVLKLMKGETYEVTADLAKAIVEDRKLATGRDIAEYAKDGVAQRVVAAADALVGKGGPNRPKAETE